MAFDVTTAAVVRTSYVSSQLTSAPFDNKLIAEAREDAAGFVASEGQLVAARLQAALSSSWHKTTDGTPCLPG